MAKGKGEKIQRTQDVVAREYTIHLHKALHGVGFKKRAPRAVKIVKAFATKMMGTKVRAPRRAPPAVAARHAPYAVRSRAGRRARAASGWRGCQVHGLSLIHI